MRKGIIYLLRAAQMLHRHGIKVRLRCIGPTDSRYKKIICDGITCDVEFIDQIPHDQLYAQYEWADVFVMPSLSDSFSLATAEAMERSCPVIVTEHVGIAEFICHGYNGYVIPIRDVDALVHPLYDLAANPHLRLEMGARGRRTVLDRLSWSTYAQRVREVYSAKLDL